jgi:hypothetical protein
MEAVPQGASEEQLLACESRIGAKLPEALRGVLKRQNGGELKLMRQDQVERAGFFVTSILSAGDEPGFGIANIYELIKSGDEMVFGESAEDLVPFADNGFGDYYFFLASDPDGKVFQDDHETQAPLRERVHLVSETVRGFLERIDVVFDGDPF